VRGFLIALTSLVLSSPVSAADAAYIAVIVDDMGNNLARGERAIRLPGQLTYAILPYTRYGKSLARKAWFSGKEVMVHMPMANLSGAPLGRGALTPALSRPQFAELFELAMEQVPHASGVNNHMGSYLTQQPMEMAWLMDEISRRRLFFVDSRTTPKTVALAVAHRKNVFSSRRDVFLDNELSFFEIDRAFQRLLKIARRNGTAIAIAHPHDVTLDYLEMVIPQLDLLGVHIIPASNLIALQQIVSFQYAARPTARGQPAHSGSE
jgi:polysaccharide deacetylase 2 family uncharacterized protein YibQ